MKKRILGTIAAGAAAVLLLSGFDSAMTVQQLQEKTKEALAQATSMWVVIKGTADADLSMKQNTENGASMDIPINGNCEMDYRISLDPFQAGLSVQYSGEAMGQGTDGSMEVYLLENEDGTGTEYTGMLSDGLMQWSTGNIEAETFSRMKDMVSSALKGDLSSVEGLPESGMKVDTAALTGLMEKYQKQITDLAQISPQSALKDDDECYELTMEVTGEFLFQMMSDIMAAGGQTPDEASLQMVKAAMSGLKVKVDTLIDANTFLPAYGTIDLGESDFSALGNLMAGTMGAAAGDMSASVSVDELKLSANFQFNEPVSVQVPPEAEEAGRAGGEEIEVSPEDLVGSLLTGGTEEGGSVTDDSGTIPDENEVIQNADGTYRIEYEDYFGESKAVNVAVPDGLALTYGSGNYLTFSNDDYSLQVSYSLFSLKTPGETVESDLDTSYYESDSSYSDVTRTDVMQTALADGTPVSYGFRGYTYNGYSMGGTCAALQVGDAIAKFEIEKEDESRSAVPATEQEVQQYASMITPAA